MSLESHSESTEGHYGEYQEHGGSLSQQEYDAVMSASYTEDDYGAAMKAVMGAGAGVPDHSFVEMTAKIVHVVGKEDDRVQKGVSGWLIPETHIFLGRY